jgi:Vault protein inter-alpha-trypsin domain
VRLSQTDMRRLIGRLCVVALVSAGCATHSVTPTTSEPETETKTAWSDGPLVQTDGNFSLLPAVRHAATRSTSPISLTAGNGQPLKLKWVESSSVVNGPVAFTELHLSFHNPEARTIEGRFTIALPEGASVSRFAMKIGKRWQEGEMVEQKRARRIYEDFLHRKVDPALLEQGAGNSFTARVFPIGANQNKELVLSYSQEITKLGQKLVPLSGLASLDKLDISIAPAKGKTITVDKNASAPTDVTVDARVLGANGIKNGGLFLARVTPIAEAKPAPIGAALVLIDTSASRALDLESQLDMAATVVERVASDDGGQRVVVACFDQTIEVLHDGDALDFNRAVLDRARRRRALGASDLRSALMWARTVAKGLDRVVLLSDGVVTAGPDGQPVLAAAKRLKDAGIKRLDAVAFGGIRDTAGLEALVTAGLPADGVVLDAASGRREILRRLQLATRSGIPVAVEGARWWWPKRIDGAQPGDHFLVYAEAPGSSGPKITVGKAAKRVKFSHVERPLIERSWAKAKIASLVDRDRREGESATRRDQIVNLSTQHRVMSPYTSLLVLETQRDYDRFGLSREALGDILTIDRGKLAVVQRAAPASGPKAPAARVSARELDEDARGNMWGDAIGESFGAGGLGLSGIGEGGGGRGEGIGLGNVGTIGHGAGTGSGQGFGSGFGAPVASAAPIAVPAPAPTSQGFGSGSGRLGRSHRARPPRVRMGMTQVSGRLPPEIIQRIVRQNFGRFRACYQQGLTRDSQMNGRVVVRFVIDRSGKVSTTSNTTSGLDPTVAACVTDAFRGLTFPQPEGGIITVSYPISFSPDGATVTPPRPAPALPRSAPAPSRERTERARPVRAQPYRGRFATVMRMLEEGDANSALAEAQAWQGAEPGEVLAIVALGEALEANQQPVWAARAYGSIIDLFPTRADLRRFAGGRLERVQHRSALRLAEDTYEKARDQRSDHPTSHRLLAYARLKRGNAKGAFDAIENGLGVCHGRFSGALPILRDDLGLIAAAWRRQSPDSAARIAGRLATNGVSQETVPSLRFVLSWETDANDVDLHLYDVEGGHAFYSAPNLASGGHLSGDVTTGYGPEAFRIVGERRSSGYFLQANYYARGPMGYGMGKVQIVEHDGKGKLSFDERPYLVMVDRGFVNLGSYGNWLPPKE